MKPIELFISFSLIIIAYVWVFRKDKPGKQTFISPKEKYFKDKRLLKNKH
jgi:hypothetical protein